jgi:hypothetical protein
MKVDISNIDKPYPLRSYSYSGQTGRFLVLQTRIALAASDRVMGRARVWQLVSSTDQANDRLALECGTEKGQQSVKVEHGTMTNK